VVKFQTRMLVPSRIRHEHRIRCSSRQLNAILQSSTKAFSNRDGLTHRLRTDVEGHHGSKLTVSTFRGNPTPSARQTCGAAFQWGKLGITALIPLRTAFATSNPEPAMSSLTTVTARANAGATAATICP
jgi:hypothetical protein